MGAWRNRILHAGADSETIEQKLYALKAYVENMILFHLYGPRFSSLGDAVDFLDLPGARDDLKRRAKLTKAALHMKRPT